jgi:hypothetical protein
MSQKKTVRNSALEYPGNLYCESKSTSLCPSFGYMKFMPQASILAPGTNLIKISSFTASSSSQVEKAIHSSDNDTSTILGARPNTAIGIRL